MSNKYTAVEMVERSGATYRMFDYWRRAGYFGKAHMRTGSGKADTGYTTTDLDRLRLLAALSAAGVKMAKGMLTQHRNGSIVTIQATPAVTVIVDLGELP